MRAARGDRAARATRARCWGAIALCAGAMACAPRSDIVLPGGTPVASADAVPAYEQAAASCRGVDVATAEMAVSGRLGRERVRGRLLLGVDREGRLRVEALAPFGEPVFVLVAEAGRATLLLPRRRQVLSDAPAVDVLDALAGLRVEPSALRALLMGCLADGAPVEGSAIGRFWAVRLGEGARAFVGNADGATRVVSGEIAAPGAPLLVGYDQFAPDGRPRRVRVQRRTSPHAVDLVLTMSQVETGVPLGENALKVRVGPDAAPITLDELRWSSPLAAR